MTGTHNGPPNQLQAVQHHLTELLEAIERCVFFLHASSMKIDWPLQQDYLEKHQKDVGLFEALSSINERFSKLQDTLGAAMRHASILSGESGTPFLKVLSFYEKLGVIESMESWQICRVTRNLAAHGYGVDYGVIAEHFNALQELVPDLYRIAGRFMRYCKDSLGLEPARGEFSESFRRMTSQPRA